MATKKKTTRKYTRSMDKNELEAAFAALKQEHELGRLLIALCFMINFLALGGLGYALFR